jgi:preprotein translocase subunit YajC
MDVMPGSILSLPLVFAQAQQPASGNPLYTLLPFVWILPILYFTLIMPQQRQERQRRAMIDAMKPKDKVVTSGGLYGTVVSIDKTSDRVVLKVDDDNKVKLTFTRASILRVLESAEKPKPTTETESAA